MKSLSRFILLLMLSFLLSGCASVSLVNTMRDKGVAAKQYRKVLVVGVASNPQMRQVFEEVFASKVTKKGIAGIPSYTITGVNEKPSRASLEEAVKKTGADGVITTRIVGMKKDTEAHAGFIMTDRGATDFYGVPVTYATFVGQPVEVTLSTEAAIETNLFDSGSGRMVWSGTSSAVNPEGIVKITGELADAVIKSMAKDGLL
jgi:hypothetical protein